MAVIDLNLHTKGIIVNTVEKYRNANSKVQCILLPDSTFVSAVVNMTSMLTQIIPKYNTNIRKHKFQTIS